MFFPSTIGLVLCIWLLIWSWCRSWRRSIMSGPEHRAVSTILGRKHWAVDDKRETKRRNRIVERCRWPMDEGGCILIDLRCPIDPNLPSCHPLSRLLRNCQKLLGRIMWGIGLGCNWNKRYNYLIKMHVLPTLPSPTTTNLIAIGSSDIKLVKINL